MTTLWHTTNEPITHGTPITDPRAVSAALRLSRSGWHTCIDGRVPAGHIYAGPVSFDGDVLDWAPDVKPVLVVARGSMGTLALDLELVRRDVKADLARLIAELTERLFG